jgi:hypothetical protein
MTTDEALDTIRLTAHQRAMATDPKYHAGYEKFLQDRMYRKGEIKARRAPPRRRRRHVLLNGWLWCRLPMPRVWLHGPRWRRFLVSTAKGCVDFDFFPDVRELVCEPVQFDRVAMWADPRERL